MMSGIEGRVCPWIGCGETIVRRKGIDPERDYGWVCNGCGEFFASIEEYHTKLKKENEWAESWFKWGKDQSQELSRPQGIETRPEEVGVELEEEEIAATPSV